MCKKNMWEKFREEYDIEDKPCKFYREYLTDIELRVEDKKNFEKRREKIGELMKKSPWLENVPSEEDGELGECVSCNTYMWCDRQGSFKNNGIEYYHERRLLCFDCFINKNDELKKKYSSINNGKCLINMESLGV